MRGHGSYSVICAFPFFSMMNDGWNILHTAFFIKVQDFTDLNSCDDTFVDVKWAASFFLPLWCFKPRCFQYRNAMSSTIQVIFARPQCLFCLQANVAKKMLSNLTANPDETGIDTQTNHHWAITCLKQTNKIENWKNNINFQNEMMYIFFHDPSIGRWSRTFRIHSGNYTYLRSIFFNQPNKNPTLGIPIDQTTFTSNLGP